jgi:serine/threonine-protein kinase
LVQRFSVKLPNLAMTDDFEVRPGVVLGRYECLLPIARGGMAAVWAARARGARGFQKIVAIKTMLPSLSTEPDFEKMFLDEARIVAGIRHPNVVEIIDLGEEAHLLYIVMEWIDGEPLSALMRTRPSGDRKLPFGIGVKVMMDVCAGLHAAHELKDETGQPAELVHRDVSPQNILVTYDGVVKLVDFGVAKSLAMSSTQTTAGQVKGKVPYMAPEQVLGKPLDRRVDVFSAGVVLYQLTTGTHPFRGDNDGATFHNLLYADIPAPTRIVAGYPRPLEKVVLKALAREPEQRYASAADMGDELASVSRRIDGVSARKLSECMTTVLGDTGEKRREAIQQALKVVDHRGTSTASVLAEPADPVQNTPASGLALLAEQLPETQVEQLTDSVIRSASVSSLRDGFAEPPQRPLWRIVAALVAVVSLLGIGFVAARTFTPSESTVAATSSVEVQPPLDVPEPASSSTLDHLAMPDASAESAASEPPVDAAVEATAKLPSSQPPQGKRPDTQPKGPSTRPSNLPPLSDPGF